MGVVESDAFLIKCFVLDSKNAFLDQYQEHEELKHSENSDLNKTLENKNNKNEKVPNNNILINYFCVY